MAGVFCFMARRRPAFRVGFKTVPVAVGLSVVVLVFGRVL